MRWMGVLLAVCALLLGAPPSGVARQHHRAHRRHHKKHNTRPKKAANAPQPAWTPEQPTYGVGESHNVPVTMSDGTVLRANVHFPTDPKTGQPAAGPFPVIMVYTPYGKDTVGAASGNEGGAEAGTQAGPMPYFVK